MDHAPLSDLLKEDPTRLTSDPAFLSGGEMGTLIRAKDWSKTSLGPIESWPQSLRTTVSLCLASNFPISIVWGPQRVQIYNDGYWPICAAKHPHSMGQDFKECWFSAWPVIGEAFERAWKGETSFLVNRRLFVDRLGYLEETFFTFSFSPIMDESGGVGGLFHPVTELTQQSLAERRLNVLRDLADRTAATSLEEALTRIGQTLTACELDVPFALFYRREPDGKGAQLAERVGLEAGSALASERVTLDGSADTPWPLAEAGIAGQALVVENLAERFGPFQCQPYDESPRSAIVQPIHLAGQTQTFGFMVAGVSSRRPLDDPYRLFYDMLGEAVANALAKAWAYEEERKRAEALAELDRVKTTFFSNVSHEFRTPLTLMLGPLEELKAQFGRSTSSLNVSEYQQIDVVHRNGLRLLKLVNTLLDFSRIEAGRTQAVYEATDLAALTADLASVFRSAIEKAGLSLIVDCPSLSEPVFVDRDMWEKIVLNLLSNAFKFTLTGEIEVTLRPSGQHGELSIRDTGTGIPEDQLGKIFERFHRVAGSQGRTHEGTGIGLSLVQELARLHGGSVTVNSVYGKGSTFRVFIPLGKSHLPHKHIGIPPRQTSTATGVIPFVEEALRWLPDDERTEARGLRTEVSDGATATQSFSALSPEHSVLVTEVTRPRVLLADDNADMREYVTRLLCSRFEVQAVADGHAALRAACADPPDVVLTDVMMPQLDGFGLLRALRDDPTTRTIPVIVLSARAGEESRVEGLKQGADDYLIKPFSARELLARVEAHVKMARMRRDTQAALRESEARFRTMADTAPAMLWMTEPDGSCSFLSRGWYEFTGQTEQEGIGQGGVGWLDAVHPDDRERAGRIFLETNKKQESFTLDYRLRRHDGEYRWAVDEGRPRFGLNGEFLGYIGSVLDITERVRQEEALRSSEEQTKRARDYAEAMLRTSPVPLLVLEKDLRVNTANEAFYRMFEVNPAETQGLLVYELANGQWNIPKLRDLLEKILPQHTVLRGFEVTHAFESVGRRTMLLNARRMENEPGTPERIVLVIEDITERKRAEEALRQLNDELEKRVAGRTQDLVQSQNRLRAMATELNLAEQRERKRLATELHDHLQQMLVLGKLKLGQGTRLTETVPEASKLMKETDEVLSDALQYTRTLVTELSPTVLRDHGLPAGLKWLGKYMQKHQIAVTVTVPEKDELMLPEDQMVLLFQSVRELLINSSKHAGTRQADVKLERNDGQLRIEVSDRGVGFDLAAAAAAAAAGTPSGGISSKFGLFSIQERMRALGGSFEIASAPGKGTTATLVLPLGEVRGKGLGVKSKETNQEEVRDKGFANPNTPPPSRVRVLLVDDHPMMREGLRSIVTAYDHLEVVGEAGDGAEAVELAQRLDPDVVVMDINMPKMDGIEATQQIKANQPATVVIGLSVNQSADTEQKMREAGASAYLTKESAVDALCHAIEQAVSYSQHAVAAGPT